jgi:hypothetical protein
MDAQPVFGAAGPLGGEDPAPFDLPLQDEPLHDEPPPPYHSVVLQSTVVSAPGAAGAGCGEWQEQWQWRVAPCPSTASQLICN